jgi:hypothetical protein
MKELAQLERKTDNSDGEECYAPRLAMRYTGKSYPTLIGWANLNKRGPKNGCPWIRGEAIRSRLLATAHGRKIYYFVKHDLDRVLKAIARRLRFPTYPGAMHVEQAARKCGVSLRTLRRAYKAYGKGPLARDMPAKSVDGRALPRSYVPDEFVHWFNATRQCKLDPDDIGVEETGRLLGLSTAGVYSLLWRGVLRAREGRIVCKGGYPRKALVLSRVKVERYAKERKREVESENPDVTNRETEKSEKLNPEPTNRSRRGPGRPTGSIKPQVAEDKQKMLEAWDRGEFPSKAAAARAYGFHRPDVSKWIKEHEAGKA